MDVGFDKRRSFALIDWEGGEPVGERHLVRTISKRLEEMPKAKRLAKVGKLAGPSVADENFIRETFPDLYEEAFPETVGSAEKGSGLPQTLAAKRR